ncbi:hypothetical protein [Oceanobacillus salinisoli]|uniref:hypothetical protein n=1 Tax=Oceanobacillus salinisoli TaxID=2678611 RepID=UPI0012E1C6FA|nr:hypothetical protein [Oceanobacillus salinisoli]
MANLESTPIIQGFNTLELAVLMEKYILILGMINYGTIKQKRQARKELKTIEEYIHHHANDDAFELANLRLQLTEEELKTIKGVEL